MPYFKLTETHYIEPRLIARVFIRSFENRLYSVYFVTTNGCEFEFLTDGKSDAEDILHSFISFSDNLQ